MCIQLIKLLNLTFTKQILWLPKPLIAFSSPLLPHLPQTIQVHLITLTTKSYIPLISESNIELIYKNNECVLLLLYFAWCPHSVKIAPFYNAIGRSYPQLHVMAMDSYNHNG